MLQSHAGSETVINLEFKCNANALYHTAFLIHTERWIGEKYYAGTFLLTIVLISSGDKKMYCGSRLNSLHPNFSAFQEDIDVQWEN